MHKSIDDKTLNRRFTFLMMTYYPALFLIDGMYSQMLSAFGRSDSFIGLVYSAIGVACLIIQPLWGYYSDKTNRFRFIFICELVLTALTMPLFFKFQDNVIVTFGYSTLVIGSVKSLFTLANSWITKIEKQGAGVDFGKMRAVGSISYAVGALILGWLVAKLGNFSMPWIFAVVALVTIYAVLRLPDPKESGGENEERVSVRGAARELFKNRNYVVFLVCALLVNMSASSCLTFYSRLMGDLSGGDFSFVGLGSFIMAAAEFFVIRYNTQFAKKLGTPLLLGIGMLGMAVRPVLYSLCTSVPELLVATLSQALSFAVFVPTTVRYVSEQIPRRYLSSGLLIYETLCASTVQIIFSPIYGTVAEKFGVGSMLGLFSIPAFLGAAIFLAYWISKNKKERANAEMGETLESESSAQV